MRSCRIFINDLDLRYNSTLVNHKNILMPKFWKESIMYPREMETGSKERDGGGEGKSLAHERGSVRGERFCVIINRTVSICTGLAHFKGKFFLEQGANLESRAAHTHPKNTQVPPPPAMLRV